MSNNRKTMREKYWLSREQYTKREAPMLEGTKLTWHQGLDFGIPNKIFLNLQSDEADEASRLAS